MNEANKILGYVAEVAADVANDSESPVVETYGVTAEVLIAGLQGLLGLFNKKKTAATQGAPVTK